MVETAKYFLLYYRLSPHLRQLNVDIQLECELYLETLQPYYLATLLPHNLTLKHHDNLKL